MYRIYTTIQNQGYKKWPKNLKTSSEITGNQSSIKKKKKNCSNDDTERSHTDGQKIRPKAGRLAPSAQIAPPLCQRHFFLNVFWPKRKSSFSLPAAIAPKESSTVMYKSGIAIFDPSGYCVHFQWSYRKKSTFVNSWVGKQSCLISCRQ